MQALTTPTVETRYMQNVVRTSSREIKQLPKVAEEHYSDARLRATERLEVLIAFVTRRRAQGKLSKAVQAIADRVDELVVALAEVDTYAKAEAVYQAALEAERLEDLETYGAASGVVLVEDEKAESPISDELPIKITAEILPGKVDPSATARFANINRAAFYADKVLIPSGDYKSGGVWLTDAEGRRIRLDTL